MNIHSIMIFKLWTCWNSPIHQGHIGLIGCPASHFELIYIPMQFPIMKTEPILQNSCLFCPAFPHWSQGLEMTPVLVQVTLRWLTFRPVCHLSAQGTFRENDFLLSKPAVFTPTYSSSSHKIDVNFTFPSQFLIYKKIKDLQRYIFSIICTFALTWLWSMKHLLWCHLHRFLWLLLGWNDT